ncbi:multicopper oxidase domain-containing protein [Cryobacterium lyxosi]|uniref:Copper-containing nitrite reductase n=1 Tax=Cryobacterium lyxosi TaxID=1259228 RepID=A0A4R8ZI99_9MICO|nr:multicopper oxidase domain-containing protein [Cryobacterium lyxosi]TFD26649.1 copper oxidase [Cryobacterium lyxosi]
MKPSLKRRLWHQITGMLVPVWLILGIVSVILYRGSSFGPWLMVHLLLLGALSTAILVWSQHFADSLLKNTAPGGRYWLGVRLTVHTVGAALVMIGITGAWWHVVLTGGILVGLNAVVHATILVRQLRGALPARFAPLVRYYIAAAGCLVVGVTLGIWMAHPGSAAASDYYDRLYITHIGLNLLGWVGLTVIGTVALLLPTVLRSRVLSTTRAAARPTLPTLLAGLVVLGTGAYADSRIITAAGVLIYLVGFARVLGELAGHVRRSPAVSYAGWSITAALAWFAVCALGFGTVVATAGSWADAAAGLKTLVPYFAVGFGGQIMIGALSFLIPVVLGGGPRAFKATAHELDRAGLFRVSVVNGALVVTLLPVPDVVAAALWAVLLTTLAAFIILMVRALRINRKNRTPPGAQLPPLVRDVAESPAPKPPPRTAMLIAAAATLALTLAVGVALEPSNISLASGSGSGPGATGHTTTVDVTMIDTRFSPDMINVPVGDNLVITLTNADGMLHDLVFDNGVESGSVEPQATTTVDVGMIDADLGGWCSLGGHRLLGMLLTVNAIGADSTATADSPANTMHSDASASGSIDPLAEPGSDFVARDARLAPAASATVHTSTMTVGNTETEVAPGITQMLWTYNHTAPGPTLRGTVGDVFEITFVNAGTIGHSLDFHAGSLAPDKPMQTIDPGEELTYRFTATRSGIWMYHCSTMPMSVHIANGMFGAVIIDPPGLTAVEQEYVLVQSEFYLGRQGEEGDPVKVQTQLPDLLTFNGYANQYVAAPLTATVGEKVRIWVLDAGPNVGSSFHVVGGQFDTVFSEGEYLLRGGGSTGTGGAQTLALAPAQGGFVELTFTEAGTYPFMSHVMSDAEKGARGLIVVTD